MDENKISQLFRDAVPDAPPPSFTKDDVRITADRLRVRRNKFVAGGILGVALVMGGVATGVLLSNDSGSTSGVAAASSGTTGNDDGRKLDAGIPGQAGAEPAPHQRSERPADSFPTQTPEQGGTASGEAGPGAGSAPTGCPKADRELATALASELPAAEGKQPSPTPLTCPDGVRAAAFTLRDGSQQPGVVSILLIPKGAALSGAPPWRNSPAGTEVKTAFGPKGNEIVLVSQPGTGSTHAPFDNRLADIAKRIAAKY